MKCALYRVLAAPARGWSAKYCFVRIGFEYRRWFEAVFLVEIFFEAIF